MAISNGGSKKRKVTNFKQTSHSKKHKSGSSSAAPKSSSSSSSTLKKPSTSTSSGSGSAFPVTRIRDTDSKKKGKGIEKKLIEIVGQDDAIEQEEEEQAEEEQGRMEIDSDLVDVDQDEVDFLLRMDKKGMATSRPALLEAYRKSKPLLNARTTSKLLSNISIPLEGPTKSELKLQKKKENRLKRAKGELPPLPTVVSDDDEGEGGAGAGQKNHPEGELIDDLDEDDLAFGSGDDGEDDGLSTMSEFESDEEMSEMSEMSDLDSEAEEVGLWSEEEEDDDDDDDDDHGQEREEEEEEWGGIEENDEAGSVLDTEGEDESEDSDVEEDDEMDEDDMEDEDEDDDDDEQDGDHVPLPQKKKVQFSSAEDELEAAYERRPKAPKPAKERPTKLPTLENGKVIRSKEVLETMRDDSEEEEEDEETPRRNEPEYRSDPLGQRFGRPAVRQLLEIKDKKLRIAKAREEIADLGREASGTGEGEGGLNLLKRLLSLTGPKFNSSSAAKRNGEKPIQVDREIRIMAMVSLLAVFIDVVPGYRIRALTEAEKEVKVSQMVARQREWEDGLVSVYKSFLEFCEAEVVDPTSPLAPVACHCMCTLVKEKPDFNFSVNIMDVIVKRLGRKGWDEGHQMCLGAIVHLLIHDTTTTASNSLHIVRLVSRLVRARSFAVRPEVISALLNLRLRDELGGGRVRASTEAVFREKEGRKGVVRWNKDRKGKKGGKAKEAMSKKGSKKTREASKERRKIDQELREAEGEIDQHERERNQTETLKLLFALYFRIVKLDYRSPLLPAALEGLARFAHLVNIDFFRDLLEVLKGIIKRGGILGSESVVADGDEEEDDEDMNLDAPSSAASSRRNDMRERLLCIVTAFELLQGQGEALMIDLGDFVSALYALILPLSLSPTFEETPYLGRNSITSTNRVTAKLSQTEADLFFRALAAIFLTPRSLPSPIRTLAFSKRILSASLHWPSASQLRSLTFLRSLLIREPKLEAMLETSDRRIDGKWKGSVDEPERAEPEGTCWWEAGLLKHHGDEKVREEVRKLMNYQKE